MPWTRARAQGEKNAHGTKSQSGQVVDDDEAFKKNGAGDRARDRKNATENAKRKRHTLIPRCSIRVNPLDATIVFPVSGEVQTQVPLMTKLYVKANHLLDLETQLLRLDRGRVENRRGRYI